MGCFAWGGWGDARGWGRRGGPGHPGVTELTAGQPGAGPWGATPRAFQVTLKEFAADIAVLSRERFGPAGLVITYPSVEDLLPVLGALAGNLVGTVHLDTGSAEDIELARQVIIQAGSDVSWSRPPLRLHDGVGGTGRPGHEAPSVIGPRLAEPYTIR